MSSLAKLKKILSFMFVFSFTVFVSAAFSQEENPDVTSKMIFSSQNAAGLTFLATPDTVTYAEQQGIAAANGLMWADKIPKPEGSESALFSGGTNQLSNDSGFTFAILTTGETNGKVAALGLNAVFYFTPENMGQTRYDLLRAKLEMEDAYEGWVLPSPSILTDLGLSVRIRYPDGKERDITSLMSFGINIGEKDSGKLLFSYGAVIVDRAVTDNEGQELYLSDENEVLVSDGQQDGAITGTWWIATNDVNADSGGGCNSGVQGIPVAIIVAGTVAMTLRRSK